MKLALKYLFILLIQSILLGCASSIVDGEYLSTTSTKHPPKPDDAVIDVYFSGTAPEKRTIAIGKISARAYVLEKGMDELKVQAKQIGVDAITNVSFERRFSSDYFQDLYLLDADAAIYK